MDKKINVALLIGLCYKNLHFRGVLLHKENEDRLTAVLEQESGAVSSEEFLEKIDLSEQKGILPNITLKRIVLTYAIRKSSSIAFSCETVDGDRLGISECGLSLEMGSELSLRALPFLGTVLGTDDYMQMKRLSVSFGEVTAVSLESVWKLFGEEFSLCFGKETDVVARDYRADGVTQESSDERITWMRVDKQIRGFALEQIGFAFQDQMPYLYFDLSFSISFVRISVLGLYMAADIPKFDKIRAGLQGLGIFFQSPVLSIGGSFRAVSSQYYKGSVTFALAKWSLVANGIYQKDTDGEHIFAFAGVYVPVGGAACFYVTGLTLGFGMRYQMRMPDLDSLTDFPLLQMLENRTSIDPDQALSELEQHLTRSVDSYFFNIGMQITSFGTMRTDVLIDVVVKPVFSLHILGRCTVNFPAKKEIVHAVVNFSAGYDDAEGALKIMAVLQTDSYLWEPECHLTGAFAVYTWLKGAHAHDFVLTIGGYAPLFEKIRESQYPHYPSVERVGINWILNEYVSVTGNAYVALTPSCLMAGGNLSLSFLDGKLKAWLVAYVDFLMQWKPWNYDLSLGVSIGASYRLDLGTIHKTFQIELAASIHFWGPPFQGRAKIDWWIISFTISFGKSEKDGTRVTFGDVEAMLAEKSTDVGSICQIRLVKGLLEQYSECEYVADSEDLRLEIHTQIPVSRLKEMQNEDETAAFVIQAQKQLFVLPMGEGICLISDLEIRVKRDSGQAFSMQTEAIYENVPYALWGEKRVTQPSADMILDVPVGVALFTQIVDSAEYLPLKGQYEERVLNGIGCGFQDKVPVVICPKEAGKTYTKEKMNWENIWKSFPGKEDHKAMLAACYGLEAEYVESKAVKEDFYHAQICFCESGKTA